MPAVQNVQVVGADAAGAPLQLGRWRLNHQPGDVRGLMARVSDLLAQSA